MMNKIQLFIKNLFRNKGIWLTLLLSLIVLFCFFGKILKHPNQVYFSKDGDGLQSYYTTIYHIKYDSTYSHFQGMNYPYGEHVIFTNCQPVISNTLKFISKNIIDVSDYAVGVINLMMLLSIIIAAVFLYLILTEFNLNWFYSTFVAIGIAYLSPLLNRFSGHYSLSYVFSIPIVIYLLIKFYKNPAWEKSLITGIFILLMSTFHMYNFAFASFILGIFWIVQLISDKKFRKWKFALLNIFLQIILPILVINVWLLITDKVHDRTAFPWGFLVYKSDWEGVFLQYQNVTIPFLKSFMHPQHVEWEGWAYIGHLASYLYIFIFTVWACIPFFTTGKMGFFLTVLLIGIIIQIFVRRRWNFFAVTDNKLLSILLWAGFLSLLFSFAWPFIFFPWLVHYAGPLSQFRGIGRFSWIFYYTINIGVFYFIYNLKFLKKYLRVVVLIISVLVLYYDAYENTRSISKGLNNNIPELSKNSWDSNIADLIKNIDTKKYQSIIPLPFFHVGSENIWLAPNDNSTFNSLIVSLKTGLPMNAVLMSRTSISQTYNNLSIVNEPYRPLEVLTQCVSEKPFLLLVTKCDEITLSEKNLISEAKLISKGDEISLYELKKEKLKNIADSLYFNVASELRKEKLFFNDNCFSTDPVVRFVNLHFEDNQNNFGYNSKSCYTGKIKEYNTIFEGTLPNALPDTDYVFSFWFGRIHHDLYPGTTIEIAYYNSQGNVYKTDYNGLGNLIKIVDKDWALIEFKFRLNDRSDKLKVTLWNDNFVKNDTLFIDELLIRPMPNNIFKEINKNTIVKNNRYYFKNI